MNITISRYVYINELYKLIFNKIKDKLEQLILLDKTETPIINFLLI